MKDLSGYCFAAAYESSILTHGLGFTKDNHMRAVREIKGKPIDWALGAVLGEILKLESSASAALTSSFDNVDSASSSSSSFIALTPVWQFGVIVLMLVTMALLVRKYKQRQSTRQQPKYSNLNAFSRV